nr:MAG TPA: hypothetical protein [Caudoviricetes sp.]
MNYKKYVCPSNFLLSFFNTITKTLRIYVLFYNYIYIINN